MQAGLKCEIGQGKSFQTFLRGLFVGKGRKFSFPKISEQAPLSSKYYVVLQIP